MMRKLTSVASALFIALVGVVVVTGCTSTYVVGLDPQSHFTYPNSNVEPIGEVRGSASKTAFLGTVPFVDAKMQKRAIENALASEAGSDVLLNGVHIVKVTPLWLINTTTLTVEGTAARMEVGKQELH